MPLDMTGDARYNSEPHYRRYLGTDNRVTVICAQDFDYDDYDPSRFLDTLAFPTAEEARQAPIDLTEMILEASDPEGAEQALRNIQSLINERTERWT